MDLKRHSNLEGLHAFLSPSKYHWIKYDEEKLDRVFTTAMAAQRGNELHDLARDLIRLGQKLPANGKTMSMYVNDAIGYRMTPEQKLYYSPNCFGTADALRFHKNILRIFDLKTGVIEASVRQLEVYAAIFCLEYEFKPFEIDIDLRIYQLDEMRKYECDPDEIMHIMEKIKQLDKRIEFLKEEARL